jgi:hypothetical protein
MKWKDGTEYNGYWLNDQRDYGTLRMSNDQIYVGQFRDDKMWGQGTLYNPNNVIYEGEFVNNRIKSVGAIFYEDGSMYFGQ